MFSSCEMPCWSVGGVEKKRLNVHHTRKDELSILGLGSITLERLCLWRSALRGWDLPHRRRWELGKLFARYVEYLTKYVHLRITLTFSMGLDCCHGDDCDCQDNDCNHETHIYNPEHAPGHGGRLHAPNSANTYKYRKYRSETSKMHYLCKLTTFPILSSTSTPERTTLTKRSV